LCGLLGHLPACSDSAVEKLQPVEVSRHVNSLLNDPTPLPSQAVSNASAATPVAAPDPAVRGEDTDDKPGADATAADGAPTASDGDAKTSEPDPIAEAASRDEDQPASAAPPAVEQPPEVPRVQIPTAPKRVAASATPKVKVAKRVVAPKAKKPPSRAPKPRRRAVKRATRPAPPRSPPPLPKPPASAAALPSNLDATDLYHRGQTLLKQGKYSDAIANLSASQRMRPSARTLTKLGQAYFDAHQIKKAEQVLRRAGNHAPALLMLGTLYQQTGQQSRARQVYKGFLSRFPDHRRAGWVRTILQAL
jgi:TolA-binding protein